MKYIIIARLQSSIITLLVPWLSDTTNPALPSHPITSPVGIHLLQMTRWGKVLKAHRMMTRRFSIFHVS